MNVVPLRTRSTPALEDLTPRLLRCAASILDDIEEGGAEHVGVRERIQGLTAIARVIGYLRKDMASERDHSAGSAARHYAAAFDNTSSEKNEVGFGEATGGPTRPEPDDDDEPEPGDDEPDTDEDDTR